MITTEIEIREIDGKSHCEWGEIEVTCGEPAIGLPKLMRIDTDRLEKLLKHGPLERMHGGVSSASREGEKIFLHIDYEGQRTTYELKRARFVNGPFVDCLHMWIGKQPECNIT